MISVTETKPTVLLPASDSHIEAVAQQCRELVKSRAMLAASASMVPIPGLHWLTDVGMLMRLLPQINEAFGLTPEQVAKLAPDRQLVVYKIVSAGGGLLFGKIVAQQVFVRMLRLAGLRLTTRQLAAFVPVVGHAVSAGLTYSVMRYVCEQHIGQCMAVCRQLMAAPEQAAAKLDAGYNPPLGV